MDYEFEEDTIRKEIEDEFENFQSVVSDEPKPYKYAMDVFKQPYGEKRTFGIITKSGGTVFDMRRESVIIDVIKRFAGKMVEQRDWAFKEMKESKFELKNLKRESRVLEKTIKFYQSVLE